jgi:hypothetical protein
MAMDIPQRRRRERHAHAISLSSWTQPALAKVADQLFDGTPDVLLINICVADTMRRAQRGDHPAHVHSHMRCADPVAPIGARSARAESTGRQGQTLALPRIGLTPTMTRAFGILA